MEEFGRMLTTYAGWGMRIEFMPDDQLHPRPALELREPDPENDSAEGWLGFKGISGASVRRFFEA